jgi:hypothetical protein
MSCRKFFINFYCAVAILLFSVFSISAIAQNGVPSKTLSPADQAIFDNEKTLITAKMKDDGAYFKRTVTDDFMLVGVDGQLQEGQEGVDQLGDRDIIELMPYNVKVRWIGENSAVVTYDSVVHMAHQEDQGPQPRYQHFSSVWVKQGGSGGEGQWKLKFHQTTPTHWGDW